MPEENAPEERLEPVESPEPDEAQETDLSPSTSARAEESESAGAEQPGSSGAEETTSAEPVEASGEDEGASTSSGTDETKSSEPVEASGEDEGPSTSSGIQEAESSGSEELESSGSEELESAEPVEAPGEDESPSTSSGVKENSGTEENPATEESSGAEESPGRRVLRAITKPGRGQIIAAVILFLVAFGGVLQVRSNSADDTYSNARQDDLVQILDGLNTESHRLQGEIEQLQQTRESLRSGADRQRVARSETRKRIADLGILAGTEKAQGPGVRIVVSDPNGKLTPELMLEGIEELRDAGAEAIEINDQLRVVASTSFGGSAGNVTVDGKPIGSPVVIEAIGDSGSLASGASFRGGFADQVTGNAQGQIEINRESSVIIDSLHTQKKNQYAHPASSPSAKR